MSGSRSGNASTTTIVVVSYKAGTYVQLSYFSLQSLTPRLNVDLSSAGFQRPQDPCLCYIQATDLFLE